MSSENPMLWLPKPHQEWMMQLPDLQDAGTKYEYSYLFKISLRKGTLYQSRFSSYPDSWISEGPINSARG